MLKKYSISFLLIVLFTIAGCQNTSEEGSYLDKIMKDDMLQLGRVDLQVKFMQPLDHSNPASEKFTQRLFIKHVGFDKPVVLVTEGYGARPGRTSELSNLLECNEIVVEHRYFKESVPDSLDWKYLTVKQSADDLHEIVEYFKQIYKGKWINTGISKGGQTTLIHRYFYPNDVDVSVPYVAPLNLMEEETRIYDFLENKVANEEGRKKVYEFQRALLKRRNEVLPIVKEYGDDKGYTYRNGLGLSYEYMVMEFSFGFWQWDDGDYEKLPSANAPAEKLFEYLKRSGSIDFFADQNRVEDPFMYQAYYQLGFYGYRTTPFKDLLIHLKDSVASNRMFLSQEVPEFDPTVMQNMNKWIKEKGNNIMYIHGGYDTWVATAVEPGDKTNAVKMVLEGANHGTRIKHFKGEQKEKIYKTLEKWLNVKIDRN